MRRSGPSPTFRVWTGARYRFSGTAVTLTGTAPCNSQFNVELSTSPSFATINVSSGWITVDRDLSTTTSPECAASWTPTVAQMRSFTTGRLTSFFGAFFPRMNVYYRVRTRDPSNGSERNSLSPGNGTWQAAAPFFVINLTGRPGL